MPDLVTRFAAALLAGGVAAAFLAAPARAEAGDPARGRALAERWCAKCHAVAPGRTAPEPAIPSFVQMARDAELTDAALRQLITLPHYEMPAQTLTRAEIGDVIAYIRTLAR